MKVCTKCGANKSLDSYFKDAQKRDGLTSACKTCKSAQNKVWQNQNPDRVNFYKRKWAANNPELRKKVASSWQKRNPQSAVNYQHRRRARKRNNGEFLITIQDIQRLMAQPCFACGGRENLTVDHIVPIARGGKHGVGNLMTLCGTCNSSKGSMLWIEWRASNRPRALEVFDSLGGTCVS